MEELMRLMGEFLDEHGWEISYDIGKRVWESGTIQHFYAPLSPHDKILFWTVTIVVAVIITIIIILGQKWENANQKEKNEQMGK